MVEITVIIEGGIVDTDTADILTVDNSQALRQSIHRIFSELLREDISVIIQLGGGYRNAASQFVRDNWQRVFLFVDLDDKKENTPKWFSKLEKENPRKPIIISDLKKQDVFFMVQEMEAWILKQPDSIDRWGNINGYLRLPSTDTINNHPSIAGKDIESIRKPSNVLYHLIRHFFQKEYDGRTKKIRYGKLKSAPGLLDQLDVSALFQSDSELQRFYKTITASTKV